MGCKWRKVAPKMNADESTDEANLLPQSNMPLEPPSWHDRALREAEQAVAGGTAVFSDWTEAKERLRSRMLEP